MLCLYVHVCVRVCVCVCAWMFVCVCFQGLELCRVIAMHMENMLSVREKRLTLPPSEITLL